MRNDSEHRITRSFAPWKINKKKLYCVHEHNKRNELVENNNIIKRFCIVFFIFLCKIAVAPFVGAWIEMYQCDKADYVIFVAPFVGAWIEIYNEMMQQPAGTVSLQNDDMARRSVRRSVDWNVMDVKIIGLSMGRSVRRSVDWNVYAPAQGQHRIRRSVRRSVDWNNYIQIGSAPLHVAPFVGAWIEIAHFTSGILVATVAPFVGAWIEIGDRLISKEELESLRSSERGLK